MSRVASLARAGPAGWMLAARMFGWRVALPLLRRRVGLTALVKLAAHPHAAPDMVAQRRVLRLAHGFYGRTEGTCLERSLLVYRYLGSAGAAPELVVGFMHEGEGLMGHAWVEVEGKPVLELEDPTTRYVSVVRYGSDGQRVGPDGAPGAV